MTEVLIMMVAGLIQSWITQVSKSKKIKAEYILAVLSLILGIGYYFVAEYMPDEVVKRITAFIAGSLGFATVAYNVIIKHVLDKET